MAHLADVTTAELTEALDRVTRSKPTQRLVAAIAYKNGVSQTELASWFDVERKTIYNWLTRLETEALPDGLRDDHRSGRPSKLDPAAREELVATLQEPPPQTDWSVVAWTPALVREHVRNALGVDYSDSSCRRILRRAGLRYRPRGEVDAPDPTTPGSEADARGFWVPNENE